MPESYPVQREYALANAFAFTCRLLELSVSEFRNATNAKDCGEKKILQQQLHTWQVDRGWR